MTAVEAGTRTADGPAARAGRAPPRPAWVAIALVVLVGLFGLLFYGEARYRNCIARAEAAVPGGRGVVLQPALHRAAEGVLRRRARPRAGELRPVLRAAMAGKVDRRFTAGLLIAAGAIAGSVPVAGGEGTPDNRDVHDLRRPRCCSTAPPACRSV